MKKLRSSGLGVKRKQAEPITIEEENVLWEKGFLGESDPQMPLDTMLYLRGICFAFRSGQEHQSLPLSQFGVQTDEVGPAGPVYSDNASKTTNEGLQIESFNQIVSPVIKTSQIHSVVLFNFTSCFYSIDQ